MARKPLAQRITTDFPDEFLSLFRQVAEPGAPEGCWEWPHARRLGYGHFYALGCTASAHRTSFAAFKGDPPASQMVRHKCDNPPCWRPDHLLLGTHGDNMADACERGRNARGETHGMAVLTVSVVRELAVSYLEGQTQRALAAAHGVSLAAISAVVRRESWREVTDGLGLEDGYRSYEARRTTACVSCQAPKELSSGLFKVIGTYRDGTPRLMNQCTPCRNQAERGWRVEQRARDTRTCTLSGCGRPWRAAGLCRRHYDSRARDPK